jgi:hypothetical protein
VVLGPAGAAGAAGAAAESAGADTARPASGPEPAGPAPAGSAPARGAVVRLLAVPDEHRDLPWIEEALQTALALELATIPPYLCAWWSVRDRSAAPARLIQDIVHDEMLHMALICNMLVAVGSRPRVVEAAMEYPGRLPGGVREDLTVYLGGLSRDSVRDVMMGIERPERPLTRGVGAPSIGSFYTALTAAFEEVNPPLATDGQLRQRIGADLLEPVGRLSDVARAVETIKEQGEGTAVSPDSSVGRSMLGHYYAFGEIYNERLLRQVDGVWEYSGDALPFPDVRPMAVVPAGGWPSPARAVRRLLDQCDAHYTTVLTALEAAWDGGGHRDLGRAIGAMRSLERPATRLMDIPVPGTEQTYGPQFRPVPPDGP